MTPEQRGALRKELHEDDGCYWPPLDEDTMLLDGPHQRVEHLPHNQPWDWWAPYEEDDDSMENEAKKILVSLPEWFNE